MKIALDALGGDFGARPNILGALQAAKKLHVDVILVGDEAVLRRELEALGYTKIPSHISIVHAPETIDMAAEPAKECRTKKNASIIVCADLVHKKQAVWFRPH